MGWDIHLFKFVDGELADADREAVRAVLESADLYTFDDAESADHQQSAIPDIYQIKFPDGTAVQVFAPGLNGEGQFASCEFNHAAGGKHLMEFVLEIARAGDMVIMEHQQSEDVVTILTRAEQADHLPSDFREDHPNTAVCESPRELEVLLTKGYSAWKHSHPDS